MASQSCKTCVFKTHTHRMVSTHTYSTSFSLFWKMYKVHFCEQASLTKDQEDVVLFTCIINCQLVPPHKVLCTYFLHQLPAEETASKLCRICEDQWRKAILMWRQGSECCTNSSPKGSPWSHFRKWKQTLKPPKQYCWPLCYANHLPCSFP